ncbi:hypothetical protein ACIPVB_04835 [Microbacterium sp. NPDC090007]|uniref:DUF7882 family protein n=1 Tax=Microbacterium sp. NPDC090007 TaxID=3364204 RepID=UPI0037F80CB0
MGLLFYGSSESPIRIPDRVLAHVKVVIATKLRRGESFTMTWRHPAGEQAGRSTIWIQPSIPMRFVFGTAEPEILDPALLQTYANSANSSSGLTVDLEEHPAVEHTPTR